MDEAKERKKSGPMRVSDGLEGIWVGSANQIRHDGRFRTCSGVSKSVSGIAWTYAPDMVGPIGWLFCSGQCLDRLHGRIRGDWGSGWRCSKMEADIIQMGLP